MTALPDYADALAHALRGVERLGEHEKVDLADAAGRVLAEPVEAERDLPPFDRAERDGYALRAAELGTVGAWPVVATIHAGEPADVDVPPRTCAAVATGAPLPRGVDAVIQHELSDRGNPVRFTIDAIEPGCAIHRRGADATAGQTVVPAGTRLGPHHLGIAAAVGQGRLPVARRPLATVLSSGDELVGIGEPIAPHQIRNSNAPMAVELLQRFGALPILGARLPDDRDATLGAVGRALEGSDLVVTTGGISAGDRDHFADAFERLEVTTSLHGASIQPGRPIFVGRHPRGTVVLGLPGNPVSVLVCACLFGWPIIRVMLGVEAALPWWEVTLAEPVKPNPRRRAFRPAMLRTDGRAVVPRWSGSGDLAHTALTAGLVDLPVQEREVAAGTHVRFLAWP